MQGEKYRILQTIRNNSYEEDEPHGCEALTFLISLRLV